MATTHREGSVFHHEGQNVTHYETGAAPEQAAEPLKSAEASPAAPEQAPTPAFSGKKEKVPRLHAPRLKAAKKR